VQVLHEKSPIQNTKFSEIEKVPEIEHVIETEHAILGILSPHLDLCESIFDDFAPTFSVF
jgi:hypothetical protein